MKQYYTFGVNLINMYKTINNGRYSKRYNILKNILLIYCFFIFLDPIRAYIDIGFFKYIGPLKGFILFLLLILIYIYKQTISYKINKTYFLYFSIFTSYIFIESIRSENIVLTMINLKYYFWWWGSFFIFIYFDKKEIETALSLLAKLFSVYAILTIIQIVFFQDTLRLGGRGGLTANPSILSYIYLSLAIFAFYKMKKLMAYILILAAFLTFTKTFMAAFFSMIFLWILAEKKQRLKTMMWIFLFSIIAFFTISNNEYLSKSFGTAWRILTYQERVDNNSFEIRKQRLKRIVENNDFNNILGIGFGRAGNSVDFANEKLGLQYSNTINTESMYMNTYIQLGIIGLIIIYMPIVLFFYRLNKVRKKNFFIFKKEAIVVLLYIYVFLVYNLTLNMFEGFAQVNLFSLYIAYGIKILKEYYENKNSLY